MAFARRLAITGFCALAAQALAAAPVAAQDAQAVGADFALRLADASGQHARTAIDRTRQLDLVSGRIESTRAKRLAGTNANSSSLAIRFSGRNAEESATFQTRDHLAPEKARRTRRTAIWFAGDVQVDSARANDPRLATVHSNGLTFGTDARLSKRLLVGNAVGAGFDRTGIGEESWLGSRSLSDTLYASAFTSKDTYLDLAVGAAVSNFESRYSDVAARASRNAYQLYARARYSKKIRRGRVDLRPYGQAGVSRTAFEDYAENGDGPTCPAQLARSYHVSMGLRGSTSFATRAGTIAPHAGVDLSRTLKTLSAVLMVDPEGDAGYRASSERVGNFAAKTGMTWSISESASVDGEYALTSGLGSFDPAQTVSARFNMRF